MIRFIVETISSAPDMYGNMYHVGIITSTKTGDSIWVKSVGGSGNLKAIMLSELDLRFGEIYTVSYAIPIRQWQRFARQFEREGIYERDLRLKDIIALEKKARR